MFLVHLDPRICGVNARTVSVDAVAFNIAHTTDAQYDVTHSVVFYDNNNLPIDMYTGVKAVETSQVEIAKP